MTVRNEFQFIFKHGNYGICISSAGDQCSWEIRDCNNNGVDWGRVGGKTNFDLISRAVDEAKYALDKEMHGGIEGISPELY